MTTIADQIGDRLEQELRKAASADEKATPTKRLRTVKARPLAPKPRGRGWRRASGKLK